MCNLQVENVTFVPELHCGRIEKWACKQGVSSGCSARMRSFSLILLGQVLRLLQLQNAVPLAELYFKALQNVTVNIQIRGFSSCMQPAIVLSILLLTPTLYPTWVIVLQFRFYPSYICWWACRIRTLSFTKECLGISVFTPCSYRLSTILEGES